MEYDLLIFHSSDDKNQYIIPLCQNLEGKNIKYWLDRVDIERGDCFADKLNQGLFKSKYILFCLSENFLKSGSAHDEFAAACVNPNFKHQARILPLILDSNEKIFKAFPLLSNYMHHDFSHGVEKICESLNQIINSDLKKEQDMKSYRILVESKHSGRTFEFNVPIFSSFQYLKDRIINLAGLSELINVGSSLPHRIKWVLVDSNADQEWNALQKLEQNNLVAMVKHGTYIIEVDDEYEKLYSNYVTDSMKFYLYAVEATEDSKISAYNVILN